MTLISFTCHPRESGDPKCPELNSHFRGNDTALGRKVTISSEIYYLLRLRQKLDRRVDNAFVGV